MAYMIKYTQAVYESKITELKGYHNRLSGHLDTMIALKEQMYDFWDDENARNTGRALQKMIGQVKNAMERTSDMLIFYESAVKKMSTANISASDVLSAALSTLNELGIGGE